MLGKGESDFQTLHLIISKCQVFNNNNKKNHMAFKETGRTANSKEKTKTNQQKLSQKKKKKKKQTANSISKDIKMTIFKILRDLPGSSTVRVALPMQGCWVQPLRSGNCRFPHACTAW